MGRGVPPPQGERGWHRVKIWGHPLSALGPQGFPCSSSTPWSPLSPFHPEEVTSGGAVLGEGLRWLVWPGAPWVSRGVWGVLPVAPGCPLRLWGGGSESVLVPAQLLVCARVRQLEPTQVGSGADRHMYARLRTHVHTHPIPFGHPVTGWVPTHAGQSLPVHHLLSACTRLCILSYACTHTGSPAQSCVSTHMWTYV